LRFQLGIVRRTDSDLVHFADSADGFSYLPSLAAFKLAQRKVLNSYPGSVIGPLGPVRPMVFDLSTVTSNRMLNVLRSRRFFPRRTCVIPPSVDTERFRPRDKTQARDQLGLPTDAFLVFALGHFRRARRLLELVTLMHDIAKDVGSLRLVLATTGLGDEGPATQLLSTAGRGELLEIVRPTDKIHLYYNAADLYVLPAASDGVIETPLSLVEAMASGTPALAFDVNACSEMVTSGEEGFIAPEGDFAGLGRAILRFARDESLSKECSRKARDRALKDFAYESVGRKLLSTYRKVGGQQS
jgi:D-inositol-3-phosphate glycosyltransferase